METKRILLVGEPMGLLIAKTEGAFEDVDEYQAATCGAELNVAIGLTRLGHQVSYLTKLGPDPFGRRIVKQMEREGISTSHILYDQSLRTASCSRVRRRWVTPPSITSAAEVPLPRSAPQISPTSISRSFR